MAKDDYHIIVYQILSYLYNALKNGEPIDENKFTCESLFNINERYRQYIFKTLYDDRYIAGINVSEVKYIDGNVELQFTAMDNCYITPKGIEYLTDNSFMQKAKDFFKEVKSIAQFI